MCILNGGDFMIMINQPFHGQLGELLCKKLTQPLGRVAHFTIFTAFAKNSGVLRLKPALEQFKNAGGYITAFIGVDAHGTSYEAVLNMFELCDELYIVHSESPASTFHSKIYELTNDGNTWIAVGSNNLTGGGLWTNYESAVCFEDGRECEDCARKVAELSLQYKDPAYPCSRQITSRDDIDELLAEDYLRSEMRIQIETHRDTRRTAEQRTRRNLFGTQNGIHLPGIERVNQQHPAGTAVHNNQDQEEVRAVYEITDTDASERMWFEMRESTGGSRNILDLSKLGTIIAGTPHGTRYETSDPEFMLGGIAFFDVDPENTDVEKSITVNYNGIDYVDCTIKFPTGDHSNGSWRIQMKGQSEAGVKIHRVGGAEWLRHKILVFEKIRTDYYTLSVLDEDQVDSLIGESTVVATNGSSPTSKKYGLL